MKILITPDKFKGTLSAKEVCDIVGRALIDIAPDTEVTKLPLADGGEGTLGALRREGDITIVTEVYDPLFRKTEAEYLISGDTAVIEMAESSGLTKVPAAERNPEMTTSYGFGQLIYDAYHNHGIRKFLLGIGGSAVNDCGIGMLSALGVRFLDGEGHGVYPAGISLGRITDIEYDDRFAEILRCSFTVMNDVSIPLLGGTGAARVYAPQKGADKEMVERLEEGAENFVGVIAREDGRYVGNVPGGGAAGGVGMALEHFLGAYMVGGAFFILKETRAAEKVRAADIVITGEGSVDAQTLHGKLVSEVISLAETNGKKCYVVCGIVKDGINGQMLGIDGLFSITDNGVTSDRAMADAGELLYELVLKEFSEILR